ncbi:MAG: C-GCAxxG-C-C family protein [Halodesulfurarchaeum sp.]
MTEREIEDSRIAEAEEVGRRYERRAGNCAQCTIAALQEAFDVDNDDVLQAASGLAGGVGSTHLGTCGALSGGVLVLGQLLGRSRSDFAADAGTDRSDDSGSSVSELAGDKDAAYELVERFIAEYGSPICRDVSDRVIGRVENEEMIRPTSPVQLALHEKRRVDPYGPDGCPSVVANAARWTGEIIVREGLLETDGT